MLLGFHPESLRGCRLCNVFTGLLSDGLWFSDYEEGIRSSAFLLLPVEGHRSALSWKAGPQELYGLVLAGAGWDLFSCVQQPRACGIPGFSFSFASARAGKGLAAPGMLVHHSSGGQWVTTHILVSAEAGEGTSALGSQWLASSGKEAESGKNV